MATLRQQIIQAIVHSCAFGADKNSLKTTTVSGRKILENTWRIFSYAQKDALIDLASPAMRFTKQNHPEIRLVRDVTVEHWNEFLQLKAKSCSTATLKQYCTKIRKLERCVNHHYGVHVNWSTKLRAPASEKTPDGSRLRIQQMTNEDFEALINWAKRPEAKSVAFIGWELSARFGYRVSGAARARVKDINLENTGKFGFGQIHIIEKGARHRDVDIRSKEDREFIEEIIADRHPDDKLVGITADSIDRHLYRAMDVLRMKDRYPVTAEHSIRKLYAQSLWYQCRAAGMTRKECIGYCNEQLGHNRTRDVQLLNLYVHDMN